MTGARRTGRVVSRVHELGGNGNGNGSAQRIFLFTSRPAAPPQLHPRLRPPSHNKPPPPPPHTTTPAAPAAVANPRPPARTPHTPA
ncbi:hypothetical protein EW146_g4670, partial [Bondarzewia mesenterica]